MINLEKFIARTTCFLFGHQFGSTQSEEGSILTCDRCQKPGMSTLNDYVNKFLDVLF